MRMTLQDPKNKLFINIINLPTMGLLLKAPLTDKLFTNLINLPKMGLLLKTTFPKVKLLKDKDKITMTKSKLMSLQLLMMML